MITKLFIQVRDITHHLLCIMIITTYARELISIVSLTLMGTVSAVRMVKVIIP